MEMLLLLTKLFEFHWSDFTHICRLVYKNERFCSHHHHHSDED